MSLITIIMSEWTKLIRELRSSMCYVARVEHIQRETRAYAITRKMIGMCDVICRSFVNKLTLRTFGTSHSHSLCNIHWICRVCIFSLATLNNMLIAHPLSLTHEMSLHYMNVYYVGSPIISRYTGKNIDEKHECVVRPVV